jgi:hypothetical protein
MSLSLPMFHPFLSSLFTIRLFTFAIRMYFTFTMSIHEPELPF